MGAQEYGGGGPQYPGPRQSELGKILLFLPIRSSSVPSRIFQPKVKQEGVLARAFKFWLLEQIGTTEPTI